MQGLLKNLDTDSSEPWLPQTRCFFGLVLSHSASPQSSMRAMAQTQKRQKLETVEVLHFRLSSLVLLVLTYLPSGFSTSAGLLTRTKVPGFRVQEQTAFSAHLTH